ncbi:MAG: glutathione S-transferase N-terminal domain-containing protein [Labilithrix sp.]|nr:glutathione S-transferase N-terminal domain-containing protein [Labilithrix sp.]
MELYFAPYACSMAVRIVADAAGVELTYREVDLYARRFADGEGDYPTANPRGQVPLLLLDDRDTLVEVSAIVQYLAAKKPEGDLMGASDRERYKVLEGLSFAATEVHKRLLFVLGAQGSPTEARTYARQSAPAVFAHVARAVDGRPFYAGESFTVADAYFAWAFIVARTFRLDLTPVEPYAERLAALPSVARALEIETPLAHASWRRQRGLIGEAPWLR